MTIQYTDQQLKQALARMLPADYLWEDSPEYSVPFIKDRITRNGIKDTELLHLCWLVEEELSMGSHVAFSNELDIMHELDGKPCDASQFKHHKAWHQRTIALCKVKGVEIV